MLKANGRARKTGISTSHMKEKLMICQNERSPLHGWMEHMPGGHVCVCACSSSRWSWLGADVCVVGVCALISGVTPRCWMAWRTQRKAGVQSRASAERKTWLTGFHWTLCDHLKHKGSWVIWESKKEILKKKKKMEKKCYHWDMWRRSGSWPFPPQSTANLYSDVTRAVVN